MAFERGLSGKIAVVTGGGSGIGEAICRRFAADGARVAVVDIDRGAAERVASDVNGIAVEADVGDPASANAALDTVERELGALDILVNNAGISGADNIERIRPRIEQQLQELSETGQAPTTQLDATVRLTDEEWAQMIAVNLSSVFYWTRRALASMQPRGTGVIINIASICGIEGCTGSPHYSAAKGGVLGFTRSVAKEVIGHGIRVNAIAPGYIDTPMADVAGEAMKAVVALQTPVGRWGRPEEVAGLAAFLAGDDASFMVGETVSPNGGYVTI
jgi:3-oxoacyl-[acyl-carrier protein] reductase